MSIPNDIDPEALRAFGRAGWIWVDSQKAFVETRQPEIESTAEYQNRAKMFVGYGELRDRGLAGLNSSATRDAGITWLRNKLGIDA